MMNAQNMPQLPIPSHFNPAKVGEVWRVPYQQRAAEAETYAKQQNILAAALDKNRICLLLIDKTCKINPDPYSALALISSSVNLFNIFIF
jgi:hypothetical protein